MNSDMNKIIKQFCRGIIFLEHRGVRVDTSAKKNFSRNLFCFQKSYEEKEILINESRILPDFLKYRKSDSSQNLFPLLSESCRLLEKQAEMHKKSYPLL